MFVVLVVSIDCSMQWISRKEHISSERYFSLGYAHFVSPHWMPLTFFKWFNVYFVHVIPFLRHNSAIKVWYGSRCSHNEEMNLPCLGGRYHDGQHGVGGKVNTTAPIPHHRCQLGSFLGPQFPIWHLGDWRPDLYAKTYYIVSKWKTLTTIYRERFLLLSALLHLLLLSRWEKSFTFRYTTMLI